MKTINYELAKKLYDAGVLIESEKSYGVKHTDEIGKVEIACGNLSRLELCDTQNTNIFEIKYPAPNVEEVIEFLGYSEIFSQYVLSHKFLDRDIFRDTLLETLEATLEYLGEDYYLNKESISEFKEYNIGERTYGIIPIIFLSPGPLSDQTDETLTKIISLCKNVGEGARY